MLKRSFGASAALLGTLMLCSCGEVEENYIPEYADRYESEWNTEAESAPPTEVSDAPDTSKALGAPDPSVVPAEELFAESAAKESVPEIVFRSENDGGRLTFSAENVFSENEYYTVSVTGEKITREPDETNGALYENLRLLLEKDGAMLDSLEITLPDDDIPLIMDSVAEGLTYGFSVISNKREFQTDAYPDIVQLELYKPNEYELPQYARFFAVFGGRLAELPIYENGEEREPVGTHPELRGEGRMVQHLCVYTPSGRSLMVTKYEYIFDVENRRLVKRRVEFLGTSVDN